MTSLRVESNRLHPNTMYVDRRMFLRPYTLDDVFTRRALIIKSYDHTRLYASNAGARMIRNNTVNVASRAKLNGLSRVL